MQVEETTQSDLRPTRAGFVRGLPLSMPVEEVIERGREAGIQLQPSDIHAARYYMRQGGGAPQQLTLGGTFASKRNGSSQGVTSQGGNGVADASKANALDKTGVVEKMADADDEFAEDEAPAVVAPKRRKIVHSKATLEAAQAKENALAKENGQNGKDSNGVALHDRLQARLANATFRETARETAREERKAERQAARLAEREERLAEREERKAERQSEREAAREKLQNARQLELQNARQSARTKQDRQARQERLEKATVGKALLNADSIKSRKRAAQATEVLEEQLRLIALRLGTQRVRELLDAMETLARQA
jgi:hypothetical protein